MLPLSIVSDLKNASRIVLVQNANRIVWIQTPAWSRKHMVFMSHESVKIAFINVAHYTLK